jgi:hypothetical protein
MGLEHEAGEPAGEEVSGKSEIVRSPWSQVRLDMDLQIVRSRDRLPRSIADAIKERR